MQFLKGGDKAAAKVIDFSVKYHGLGNGQTNA